MARRVLCFLVVVGAALSGWCVQAGAATTPTSMSLTSSLGGTPATCPPTQPPTYCQPPVYPGTVVRFTARVLPQSGSATPTGSVTFMNGSTALGAVPLDANATAFVDVTAGGVGSVMSVTVSYGGDANFASSSSGAVSETSFGPGAVYTPTTSGYVLDGWGGLHPWSQGAMQPSPVPAGAPYWPGWNIARGFAIGAPMNSCSVEVDGWGGIHQLTWPVTEPAVVGGPYWVGWDIVRDVVLLPDCTGGYVLDGWGGLHPFGLGHTPPPQIGFGMTYWHGWDIARAVVILPDGSGGYIFDAWGGAHPFALTGPMPPPLTSTVYFPGADLVRGATIDNRYGILLVEPDGATASAARAGTVPPAALLGTHLTIPIGEGIAAFGN